MQKYSVDPERVYIGGFSGGSRVALRIALGYPDVFHGALLDAGSDPIGDAQIPLPPAELFRQFQDSTRLVFLTGKDDVSHLDMDARSQKSMHEWCKYDLDSMEVPRLGHELAGPAAFNHALEALDKHAQPDPGKIVNCRARIQKEMTAELQQVEDLLVGDKVDGARTLLNKIDSHYGGLAAPRSTELEEKMARQ